MTQRQLEALFWRATMCCLGLDPDSEDQSVQRRVRISWPLNEASDWERDENVVFLRITPGSDTYGTLWDVSHEYDADTDTQKEVVFYHRSHHIAWICYGPEADDNADAIRIGIVQSGVHSILKAQNVSILPHLREPIRVPEQDEAGEWWERVDLEADCYSLCSREYDEEFVSAAPTINLKQEG